MSLNNSATQRKDLAGRSPWVLPGILRELVSVGEAGLVLELIGTFEADTAPRLRRMRVAATVGDRASLRAEAHNTKGSSLQMGAVALAATFELLEFSSPELPTSQQVRYIEIAERQFACVCQEMALFSPELQPVLQGSLDGCDLE
jgi:HPt (histidine-containing phosphotransfer) domain-containing protein